MNCSERFCILSWKGGRYHCSARLGAACINTRMHVHVCTHTCIHTHAHAHIYPLKKNTCTHTHARTTTSTLAINPLTSPPRGHRGDAASCRSVRMPEPNRHPHLYPHLYPHPNPNTHQTLRLSLEPTPILIRDQVCVSERRGRAHHAQKRSPAGGSRVRVRGGRLLAGELMQ